MVSYKDLTSSELIELGAKFPKHPMVVDEVVSTLARCEMVVNNVADPKEQYFAEQACAVLSDLGEQMYTLLQHPQIDNIVADYVKHNNPEQH